jgi:DNA-binding response OmpR family regulator
MNLVRAAGGVTLSPSMAPSTILVVEDDPDTRELLSELLTRAGHHVAVAEDGAEALRSLFSHPPRLVLLDVGLPGMDGWQVLGRIREVSEVPVLMLTAASAELEKVRGLAQGADDYVTKPFGRQELVARVNALLRRAEPSGVPETYADGFVTIDFGRHSVSVDGAEVQLTPLEFKLLATFVRHPRQVLSPEQLLAQVWGDAGAVSRDQVKVYVGYLRRKLSPDGPERTPIETVRGFGYRYDAA